MMNSAYLSSELKTAARTLREGIKDLTWLSINVDVENSGEIEYGVFLTVDRGEMTSVYGPDLRVAFNEAVRRARWERDAKMKALPEPEAA